MMPKKKEPTGDETLSPSVIRLEATEKAGPIAGVQRVFGEKTARALVASGRWKIVDTRYTEDLEKRTAILDRFVHGGGAATESE